MPELNYVSGSPKEQNPNAFITPMQDAENRTSDVVARLARITDQLCGGVPEQAPSGPLRSVPNGLFDVAANHGQNISEMLDKANQCLSRIERALP